MIGIVFICVALIAPYCFTEAQGPPEGARGTIDFRYPDYIVEPRPPCLSEGVFPHPRNCSWFFRCHDAYDIGYYRQFYFECEPGTVFSDELDQCVFPYLVAPPCGTAGGAATPGYSTFTIPPTPPPTTPMPVCYDSMYKCKVYFCPDSTGMLVSVGKQCASAVLQCSDGKRSYYCAEHQFFDINTRTCVPNPELSKCLDEDSLTTTTTTTTPAPTTPKPCHDSMIECKKYICPSGPERFLCKKAFKTCNFNELTFYCNDLQYYDYDTKGCVLPPAESGCTEKGKTTTTTTTVATTTVVDPFSFTFTFTVECSVDDLRPRDEQLAQYYCRDVATCENGVTTEIELCLKYLQCTRSDDAWQVIIMDCPEGLYYSYKDDRCRQTPAGGCDLNRKFMDYFQFPKK